MARSSEVEALRRSGRARPLLLGGLAALAGVLALWELARPKPRGLPERRDAILVVDDPGGPDAARALRRAGFDVAVGDFADWAGTADELGIPDARLVHRILSVADERGYGHVAFELGRDEISKGVLDDVRALGASGDAVTDETRELVVSVGDLGSPHVVTVAPAPSAVVRMGAIGLVRAAFAQPSLAPDRPSLVRRPSLEELLLDERLDPGVRMIKRIETLEASARRMQEEVERTVASIPDAPALHDPLSSGGVVPIGEGEAITITRKVELVSFDGDFLDLDEAAAIMVRRVPWREDEGHAVLGESQPCTELGLADAAEDDVLELRAASDGRTWLVVRRSSGTHVWSIGAAEAGAPCGFVDLGALPEPSEGTLGQGVPGPGGRVARVRDLGDGRGVVEVVTPGPSSTTTQLMEFPLLRLAEPVWIDERHLAVFGRGSEDSLGRLHQELMLLDAERPLVGVKLDLTAFVGSAKVSQVLPVMALRRGILTDAAEAVAAGLDVFILSGKEPRQIHRIHVDLDLAAALRDLDDERRRLRDDAALRTSTGSVASMAGAAHPAGAPDLAGTPGEVPSGTRGPRGAALGSADPSAGRTVASTADTEGLTAPGAPAERALPELAAIGGPGADGVGAQRSDAEVLVSLVPLERTVHDLLAARGEVWDLTVDPQRTRLAFTWQPEPKGRRSIATLALDGTSTIRPAGRDRGDERRPRFDPSGRRLLFEATFPLSVMERMLVIPGLSPPVR